MLTNDADPNGLAVGLTIASVDTTGTAGDVTVAPDGKSVIFTPTTGFSGTTTFKYFTTDSEGLTSNEAATVTVNVNGGIVWYVDADMRAATARATAASCGRSRALTQLNDKTVPLDGDVDGANDTIFVYDNAAGTLTYNGGIVLEAGQKLIGDGVAFSVNTGVTSTTGSTSSGSAIGHSADEPPAIRPSPIRRPPAST